MVKRVAIIGAGASGLPAIRHARFYNLDITCFEASNDIGGLWRYKPEETDESSVMKSTIINSSKELSAYSDFPPLPEMANFMHNTELLRYLRLYAEHYDLRKYIKFNTKVLNVKRAEDYDNTGQWDVTYKTSEGACVTSTFDSVMLCTGHHTTPYLPKDWDGQRSFDGTILHSHSYKDHKGYEDKTVVVVGVGNSGGDIAVELSRIAKQVYLVTRRGTWVFNRVYDKGIPFDIALNTKFLMHLKNLVPESISSTVAEYKLNGRFDHSRFGLKPAHRIFSAHPTVNDELPNRIACGMIKVKPNIRKFKGRSIEFMDGSVVDDIDTIIMSTGYSFEFNLVEDGKLIPVTENQVDLYQFMYPIDLADHNTLAVIGLIQPLGSIMPISEMQARIFFENLYGKRVLPSKSEMRKNMIEKRDAMNKRYVASRRHTIQVDYIHYMDELASLIDAKPDFIEMLKTDPFLAFRVEFGPCVPYIYRLKGPHPWEKAKEAIETVNERVYRATNSNPYVESYLFWYIIGGIFLLFVFLYFFLTSF